MVLSLRFLCCHLAFQKDSTRLEDVNNLHQLFRESLEGFYTSYKHPFNVYKMKLPLTIY